MDIALKRGMTIRNAIIGLILMHLLSCCGDKDLGASHDNSEARLTEFSVSPKLQNAAVVATGDSIYLRVNNGRPPFTFNVLSGGGHFESFDGTSIIFVAPSTEGLTEIRVSDSSTPANIRIYKVTITGSESGNGMLSVGMPADSLWAGSSFDLRVSGGQAPYSFKILRSDASSGRLSGSRFVAPATQWQVAANSLKYTNVQITDAEGNFINVKLSTNINYVYSLIGFNNRVANCSGWTSVYNTLYVPINDNGTFACVDFEYVSQFTHGTPYETYGYDYYTARPLYTRSDCSPGTNIGMHGSLNLCYDPE